MNPGQQEISLSERFQFGENWKRFLRVLNKARIAEAENSLKQMLEVEQLTGIRFEESRVILHRVQPPY